MSFTEDLRAQLVQTASELAAERAAHEQTRAELEKVRIGLTTELREHAATLAKLAAANVEMDRMAEEWQANNGACAQLEAKLSAAEAELEASRELREQALVYDDKVRIGTRVAMVSAIRDYARRRAAKGTP